MLSLVFVVLSVVSAVVHPMDKRVVGGNSKVLRNSPWNVLIVFNGNHDGASSWYCGGTIIGENAVVTAKICTEGMTRGTVYYGTNQLKKGTRIPFTITEVNHHPKYPMTVVKLPTKLKLKAGYVEAVDLARASPNRGDWIFFSGFGQKFTDVNKPADLLQGAQVRTSSVPSKGYFYFNNRAKFACGGDLGGPVICRYGKPGGDVLCGIIAIADCAGKSAAFEVKPIYGWLKKFT